MTKVAVVTGSSGQDGSYLCELLLKKNYKVLAYDRRSSREIFWRHNYLKITKKLNYRYFDLSDENSINKIFLENKVDEFYNLAAQSFVKSSFDTPVSTSDVTALGPLRILEAIKLYQPKVKFYQASSSEMFGDTKNLTQNENTKFYPRSPYAISKTFAHYAVINYRESYNLYACSGILFNHESPLRGEEFVTRKITKQLSEIYLGKRDFMELGNIYSKRDWGYAKDYVEAIWKMLNIKKPLDFVISTNKTTTIKKFIEICCQILNLPLGWGGKGLKEVGFNKKTGKVIIKINKNFYRPSEVNYLRGNFAKAKKLLNWKPKTDIYKLAALMLEYDLKN